MSKLIISLIAAFIVITVAVAEGEKGNQEIVENVENDGNVLSRIRRELQNPSKREANKRNKRRRNRSKKERKRSNDSQRRKGNNKKKNAGKQKQKKHQSKRLKKNQKKNVRRTGRKLKKRLKNLSKKSKSLVKSRQKKKMTSRQETFCPVEKATSLKLLYNQVYNFQKQLKRAENHASIVKKKNSKSTIFMKDALILTDIVGGNLSEPSCSSTSSKSR